jgi:multidrug efflux pump subunit AcrB
MSDPVKPRLEKLGIWAALLRHPILVGLGAAALILFGIVSLATLPIRPSPPIPANRIKISTHYPGASAAVVNRFVTIPIETDIAAINGIAYVTGVSRQGVSHVRAYLGGGIDPNTVFAETLSAVNAARTNLPSAAHVPTVYLVGRSNGNQELNIAALYAPGISDSMVTRYMKTDVIPRLETVPHIGAVRLFAPDPAIRVALSPARMSALGVTPAAISTALADNATLSAAGSLRNAAGVIPVEARPGLANLADFGRIPVSTRGGVTIPLSAVAKISLGPPSRSFDSWWAGQHAVYLAAGVAPGGNLISVARNFRRVLGEIRQTTPPGLKLLMFYDQSVSVMRSLKDLAITLVLTILLVAVIVRLSLGTMRAASAPFLAILLSLFGTAIVMHILGESLNLFTIIALVLAVGLVVDDAIVVVEDIFRRINEGETPLEAASDSVTRLAPVLAAISSTLVVAFLPLVFLKGLTAALFRPFAIVLITAFLFSLLIALTVVPLMALWAGRYGTGHAKSTVMIDRLRDFYVRRLTPALRHPGLIAGLALLIAIGSGALYAAAPRNLTPAANGLSVNMFAEGPYGASITYLRAQYHAIRPIISKIVPDQPEWMVADENYHGLFGGYVFDSPSAAQAAVKKLGAALRQLPGVQAYVSENNGLPGLNGLPIDVLISGQTSYGKLLGLAQTIIDKSQASGDFDFLQASPGAPRPQYVISIRRRLAASLGLSTPAIGDAIAGALAGATVAHVSLDHATLDVIPTGPRTLSPAAIGAYTVRAPSGALIPLASLTRIALREQPSAIGSWQGLPTVTIQGQPKLGVSLSAALHTLHTNFKTLAAPGLSFGYAGPSATFRRSQQENNLLFALGFAGLFFLLAGQFRSLRDPFVIITTVPLASLGPLALIALGGATLNIVTEIALLAVWGLIARQGILFVQIAHDRANAGLPITEAALAAARLRFRPILMITLALIGGSIPLILANGPQSVIRYDIGVILASGMLSGFLLSLFAVPALYVLLHSRRH